MEHLKYPIGHYQKATNYDGAKVQQHIIDIAALPTQIRAISSQMTSVHLQQSYRSGGWTASQVIHHLPDSHLNSYIRFKWALTEKEPIIKAYNEVNWAELPDAKAVDISYSLDLLESLHRRWVLTLANMTDEDFNKKLIHPSSGEWFLYDMVGMYAWHGKHHLGHLKLVMGDL